MFRLHFLRPRAAGHISRFHAGLVLGAPRKSLKEFKLADIGEGITECEVIRWFVYAFYMKLQRVRRILLVQECKAYQPHTGL